MLVLAQLSFDVLFMIEVFVTNFPRSIGLPNLVGTNEIACTIEGYFYLNMVAASLTFSGLVSYERYRAVLTPFKVNFLQLLIHFYLFI